ncbi:D-alanyl-D-alanine carboxypeptidase [Clostridium niameyense]|uniref:serine-type D-Ala-D-Ala carboxypeptidase n=1 Tax=Clostridium niameyense TaxID=1622073 RepID=A0A6M0R648_9CLOT|nr:D-alanyl-D-alanine carboxypeptidase [Clostridium niameyense]
MKKTFSFLISLFLFISLFSMTIKAKETIPKVSADSAVLMDATTGKLLYSKNADKAYPPASTTKIMTALLTLEKTNLNNIVTIGKNPPLADGSKIYVFEGEKIKVRDLLYGLLLASGNDCAEALAEYIGGSQENFAKMMNKRASELGCTNTNFENPSGLYSKNHKTSSKDLAIIMRELVKHPEYTTIATTSSYNIAPTNKSKESRPLWNSNKLIQKSSNYYYGGCEGGKTGYTTQSEHSYVASVTKNNQRLIVALVHDNKKTFFEDSIKLFDYGFNNYSLTLLYPKNAYVTSYKSRDLNIPLYASKDFYYLSKKNEHKKPNIELTNVDLDSKDFKKGDIVLDACLNCDDQNLGVLKLKSGADHQVIRILNNEIPKSYLNLKFIVPLIGLLIVVLIFLIKFIKNKKQQSV